MIDGFELPPGWPRMTLAEANARLTAPGARFEMEEVAIRGVPTRTWKNAPPDLGFLTRLSRMHGARIASVYEGERVSYEGQFRAIAALAAELLRLGVAKGDRVAIAMANLPEWPIAFFAAATVGAIAVPLNAWWTGAELEYGLADSGAKLLIADDARWTRIAPLRVNLPDLAHVIVSRAAEALEEARRLEDVIGQAAAYDRLPDTDLPYVAVAPDDPATIFYTSGTTGRPKGALGTHRNLTTNILSVGFALARAALRRGDEPAAPSPKVGLMVIPLFHVTACSASLMGSMAVGNTTVYVRKWDPLEALEIIERERVNVTGGVPTIAWQILEHPERARFDLSSLEMISYGGAPSAPELVRRIHAEFGALPATAGG